MEKPAASDERKPSFHYNEFYAKGGWKYSAWRQKRFLRKRVVEPLGLEPGARVLEIGCGRGVQSNALAELGFDVVGADLSEAGIQAAKAAFPKTRFLCLDAARLSEEFAPETFGAIYCRGMSWYHYDLAGVNFFDVDVPARTADLFQLLEPGGVFVLQIMTDFSGGRFANGVHHNTYGSYVSLFEPLGTIVLISNWKGKTLGSDAEARRTKGHVIIATRRNGT